MTAAEIDGLNIPPLQWCVEGLIPEGFSLLVGGSKVGKSWAALDIGLAVASGNLALGYFKTTQGEVLYLALEDGPRRIQGRLKALWGDNPMPSDLHIGYGCDQLPELISQLDRWCDDHKDARLIMIDVLAKVRPSASRHGDVYQLDYAMLGPLQNLAMKKRIGLVLVHHTNQNENLTDDLSRVSGSTGVVGTADTAIIFKRSRNSADGKIYVTGRDVVEKEYTATFINNKWCVIDCMDDFVVDFNEMTTKTRVATCLRVVLANGPQMSEAVYKEAGCQFQLTKDDVKNNKGGLARSYKQGNEWWMELTRSLEFAPGEHQQALRGPHRTPKGRRSSFVLDSMFLC